MKVVFATETLALGINMPARTVVLEKLEKFNGEARVAITSGEYTQLTGRAGRRGIDVEGHAVIQWTEGLDPQAVAALASRRTYPLNSSFRPTYNMAVNLIDQFGRARAREILESSFAQFQADRAVVGLARQVREQEESLAGYEKAMTCDRGDFTEYSAIRRELSDLEKLNRKDATAPRATREKRQRELGGLRRRMQRHPCHQCPDRENHARWAERYWRLKRTIDKMRQQIDTRTGTVARIFDRVVDVLAVLDYVRVDEDGATTLTPSGRTMRRIYGERDLLVAESLRLGLWDEPGCRIPRRAGVLPRLRAEARRGGPERARAAARAVPRRAERDAGALAAARRPRARPPAARVGADLGRASRRRCTRGRAAARSTASSSRPTWPPATSCAGRSRRSICSTSCRSSPSRASRTTARKALDAVRRGIVSYSSV